MKGNRLWLLGTVAVIAIVVVLGWVVGISPKLAEGSAAIAEQQTVDSQNLMQAATLAELEKKAEDIDDLRANVETLRKFIPATQSAEAFLAFVQRAADAAVVQITNITVAEPTVYGEAPIAEGAVAPPTTDENAAPIPGATAPDGVLTIAVSIEVSGAAPNVIVFSRIVQVGDRLFVAPKFTFVPDETKGTLSGFLYVIADPAGAVVVEEDGAATEPTPEPTETPEPSPTPTATNG